MNDKLYERFANVGEENPTKSSEPAGFWIRVCAVLLDTLFTIIIGGIIGLIFGITGVVPFSQSVENSANFAWLKILFFLVYYVTAESSTKFQGTLGKYVLGLKITREDGTKLTFGRAFGRNLAKWLSGLIFCIGFIMVGLRKDKRGLHDLIANTYVVRR